MSSQLFQSNSKTDSSFFIGIFQDTLEKSTWHYHNGFEINFILEGVGKRIIGDSIESFFPGDMIFIGQNMPHVWLADKHMESPSGRYLETAYLQFDMTVLPDKLLSLPEFKSVSKALRLAERGMKINDQTLNEVSELMLEMPYMEKFQQMMHFYKILDIIGRSTTIELLVSEEYARKRFTTGNRRIATIHEHMMIHYREKIDLDEMADLVSMAKGSLCRFFKSQMGMTIFEYLNQIKIELSCNLLRNPDLSILDVAFDSGFNNLSHFNKQFKKVTGQTPSEYRKQLKAYI